MQLSLCRARRALDRSRTNGTSFDIRRFTTLAEFPKIADTVRSCEWSLHLLNVPLNWTRRLINAEVFVFFQQLYSTRHLDRT